MGSSLSTLAQNANSLLKPRQESFSYFDDGAQSLEGEPRELIKRPPTIKDPKGLIRLFLAAVTEDAIKHALKRAFGPQATTIVQRELYSLYEMPFGKEFITRAAGLSLNKSVYGAAAISHLSKILGSRGMFCLVFVAWKSVALFLEYCDGNIDAGELGKGLLKETMGEVGNAVGWLAGSSLATALLVSGPLAPFLAITLAFGGFSLGRWAAQSLTPSS